MSKKLTQFYKNYSKQKKVDTTKIVVWIVLVFAVFIVLIVSVGIGASKTKKYSAKNFYFVYADKYTSNSMAQETSTKVSDLGGAGIIYLVGNTKFVVVNAYTSEADAKQVATQIKNIFNGVDVIKVTAPKLSKQLCNKIENNFACKEYYNQLYNFCLDIYNWSVAYDKGDIDVSKVYKNIMSKKQKLAEISALLKEQTSGVQTTLYNSSLLVLQQISVFFNSAFVSNNVGKYIKKLYINSIIEFVDMCQNLK